MNKIPDRILRATSDANSPLGGDGPSAAAHGPSDRKAPANVEVVMKAWIEAAEELGTPIPEPKDCLVFA